jgi:ParB family chromosome partitioning protein
MAKNFGLGKGLGALISEYDTDLTSYDKDGNLNKGVSEIELSMIDPNPDQPRKNFDETSLRELAASIINHGVIQPIILANRGDRYIIVAGERRYRAARIAKLERIPAIVTALSEKDQKEIMIIENLQREDLNPIEEASGLQTLINEYKLTQEELAVRLGKSRPAITNALRLLTLPDYIQKMLIEGKISSGHARALVSVKDPVRQRQLAEDCAANKLTVRQLEMEVNGLVVGINKPAPSSKTPVPADLLAIRDRLVKSLSTKVKITGSPEKGKIVIEYKSPDDLVRLAALLEK